MNRIGTANRNDLKQIARQAMIRRGLLPDFSPAALAQTNAIANHAARREPSLRDLRGLSWCSIDNDDSRDLDQLTVADVGAGSDGAASSKAGGAVKILVAIADVDASVEKGTPVDGHARTNTTSVYTAAQMFPMLPEKLSTDLTSLSEGQERAAIVIEMTIGADGTVQASDVFRALVLNRAKLAYNGVAAWLDGTGTAPARLTAVPGLAENLRIQDRVAQTMKGLRHQRGALGLETIEARPVFDGDLLTDLLPDEKNRAKELIEDFMIGANGVTAQFLESKGSPALRRVLRSPERWARIVELAADLGAHLPPEASCRALGEFLTQRSAADPERFPDLSLTVVKLLGRGEYVLELPGQHVEGHFGLAVRDYTHSTAPNRRFPDLVTQRLLKAALAGARSPYANDELAALARHCTDQEDNAAKVERQVSKSAAALLLAPRLGERFDAIVTGASEKGTFVRILRPAVEGMVVRGFENLDVGDRVRVELVHTDVERGYIDFARSR